MELVFEKKINKVKDIVKKSIMNQRYSFYDIKYSGFNLIFEKVNFSLLKKKN